jgi:hypothetical protein
VIADDERPPAGARARRRRRALRTALVVALSFVALLAVGSATTHYDTVHLMELRAPKQAPAWTAPCRGQRPPAPPYVLPCGRVDGIVVWVQKDDPDRDGDVHVVALAGPRLVIVKYKRKHREEAPGLGHQVHAAGPLSSGESGRPEITVGGFH